MHRRALAVQWMLFAGHKQLATEERRVQEIYLEQWGAKQWEHK